MTKEQQVTKQSLFENGSDDYASPAHLIEQYKAGNCPLGDVQASIESIMEQYAKERAVEFAKWMDTFGYTDVGGNKWESFHNMSGKSIEELYQRFIQSKETT